MQIYAIYNDYTNLVPDVQPPGYHIISRKKL